MDAKPVIVGIDGSPDSLRALQWGAEYAKRFEGPLQVMISWDVSTMYGDTFFGKEDYSAVEKKHREILQDAVREALGDDAEVTERVERGHPSEALVKASKDAQLVVVGSRGRGSFAGMLLGSVSQHLVSHARCPVIVMQREDPKKKKKK